MGDWINSIGGGSLFVSDPSSPSPALMAASVLIALFIGFAIAWIYERTHHGLSYSAGFTQSLVLITLGASLLMVVIGGSIVTAFGLLGALAIVRFRNVLKDTKDTVFVFFALVLGMAAGTGRIGLALCATVMVAASVTWLHLVQFGSKGRYDGHVTWSSSSSTYAETNANATGVLAAFCSSVREITLHDAGGLVEQVLAVRLRDRRRVLELVEVLRTVPGIDDASIVVRDAMDEL